MGCLFCLPINAQNKKAYDLGFPLKVVKVFKNVLPSFEFELHKKYENYRLHGEWFAEEILSLLEESNAEKY